MTPPGGESGGAGILTFLPLIVIFLIFYFLIIRPQHRKQKEHQELIRNLRKGDKVVTTGGIHGSIVGINEKDDILVLRIADNVKVEVSRSAVSKLKE